jgi:hypothetical protein
VYGSALTAEQVSGHYTTATSTSRSADTSPPDTHVVSATTDFSSGTFSFFGSDDIGVTGFECSMDGSAWASCPNPVSYYGLSGSGHTFRVRAKDAAGNVDPTPDSYAWGTPVADTTAPDTAITSAAQTSTNPTFTFTGSDNVAVSSYECALDGGSWAACSSPRSYSALATGGHTFQVRARDAAGNTDATPATATWNASGDTVAPDTTITSAAQTTTSPTFTFTGSDNVSVTSYQCAIDGGAWAICTSPASYGGLTTGSHTFQVRAKDGAGNFDATPASVTWTAASSSDSTPPDTHVVSATTDSASATFSFFGSDNVAVTGFECSLDGSAWATCPNPVSYYGLSGGGHNFLVRARDAAGNVDPTPDSYTWGTTVADTTAPDTAITSAAQTSTNPAFTFTGTDNVAVTAFDCSLDGAAWAGCTNPKSYSALATGSHTFKVRARDAAGNTDATPATTTWSASGAGCPVPASSRYGSAISATAGLVSYWRLGETSGTAACDATGRNSATYAAGVTLGRAGAPAGDPDRAATLDGTSGEVDAASDASLNPVSGYSVEAWVAPAATTTGQTVARRDGQFLLRMDGSSLTFRVYRSGGTFVDLSTPAVVSAGAWQQVVATWDGTTMRIYRNGTQAASVAASGTPATVTAPLRLGSSTGYDRLAGGLDDVSFYNGALSAAQVQSHYSSATASGGVSCTIYVSPSGSAGSTGGSASSPTTLASAVGAVVPGSVVCLAAGTYPTSSNIILSRSGTSSAPITYRSNGGTPLLQYTGGALAGGVLQLASGSSWGGAHHIVIDGLTIDGNNLIGSGVFAARGAHHLTVRNSVIRNTGSAGIVFNANDYVVATNNLISHVGYAQGTSSGISLWNGGPSPTYGGATAWYDTAAGFHNVIAGNVISGAYDTTDHQDGNGIIVDGSGSIPPALIAGNLTYENGGRGIEVNHTTGDVWVINNTAYANGLDRLVGAGEAPDLMANVSSSVHFVNNIGYGRKNGSNFTTAFTYNNTQSTIAWARNMAYNGSTAGISSTVTNDTAQYRYSNPLFSAAPPVPTSSTPWTGAVAPWAIGTAFTLQAASPAINAGIDPHGVAGMTSALAAGLNTYLSSDLAGNPRTVGTGIDIGAYER